MKGIKVHLWDTEQFRNSKDSWSELLERSTSDKLFMSWEWLFSWWNVFSKQENMELYLLAAFNSSDTLVGIAPLYLKTSLSKKIVKTQRLQLIGNCWREIDTMRTELQDFIVDSCYATEVIHSFAIYLNNSTVWDELVLADLNKDSETYKCLIQNRILSNCYYRNAEESNSYYLELNGTFDTFCRRLGKNMRLKLFNRRKLLCKLGNVEFIKIKSEDIKSTFELLNSLHLKRWGRPAFEHNCLHFNMLVAELMAQKEALQFTVLKVDNIPISIQYNYIIDNHEYNIQAGFDEGFHKKIALGYLHFGYAIEAAFNDGVKVYDFLAGEGKNTQYKARLTDKTVKLASIQVVRNKLAKKLYRSYDYLTGFIQGK